MLLCYFFIFNFSHLAKFRFFKKYLALFHPKKHSSLYLSVFIDFYIFKGDRFALQK